MGDLFKTLTDGANGFGALEASGVWALMFIVMFWERQQIRKRQNLREDQWLETRMEQEHLRAICLRRQVEASPMPVFFMGPQAEVYLGQAPSPVLRDVYLP